MAFVFYDTETTGTDKQFDQILQFAAIRTDENLVELERFECRCRIRPYVTPAPGALCVTGVPIQQCLDASLPSNYEMTGEIYDRLSTWSPSMFLGWNSLEFDEELVRQNFYVNLYPAYLTNTNGNSRTDVLKVAQACAVERADAIEIPVLGGKPKFKLDLLAPLNGFPHNNAHDALADVEATIHMARLLRDRAPQTWGKAMRFAQKAAAKNFLETEPGVVLTEVYFNRPYQYAVGYLGQEPRSPCAHFALDLTQSVDGFLDLAPSRRVARLSSSPRVVRRVKVNKTPLMESLLDVDDFQGHDPEALLANAEAVLANDDLREALVSAASQAYSAHYVSDQVEQMIYDGFPLDDDKNRFALFHAAPWHDRPAIVETFTDQRFRELGFRLIHEHAPNELSGDARATMERFVELRRFSDSASNQPWRTVAAALRELADLRISAAPHNVAILDGLERELRRWIPG